MLWSKRKLSAPASYLTITNWRLLSSLHMKPPKILGGHSEKIEKFYKFSQKSETFGHQFSNSNHNSHCVIFSNKLPIFIIIK